jgi:hypothetical protein
MKVFSVGLLAVGFACLPVVPAAADVARPAPAGFDLAVARLTVEDDAINARVTMVNGQRAGTGRPSRPCTLTVVVRNSAGGIKDTLEAPIRALEPGEGVDLRIPLTPERRLSLSGTTLEATADALQVNVDGNRRNNTRVAQVPALRVSAPPSPAPETPKDPAQSTRDLSLEDGSLADGRISWNVRNVDQVKPFTGVRTIRVKWSYKTRAHNMNQGEWMTQGVDDIPPGATSPGFVIRPDLVKDAESYTFVIEMTPHDRNPDNDRLVLTDIPKKKPAPVKLDDHQ